MRRQIKKTLRFERHQTTNCGRGVRLQWGLICRHSSNSRTGISAEAQRKRQPPSAQCHTGPHPNERIAGPLIFAPEQANIWYLKKGHCNALQPNAKRPGLALAVLVGPGALQDL